MKKKRLFVAVSIAALSVPGCATTGGESDGWAPPAGGVIRDKMAAVSIARAVWSSMNPSLDVASESEWQKGMQARLDGAVWRVSEKSRGPDEIGGVTEIDLSATDGRVLRIVETQ